MLFNSYEFIFFFLPITFFTFFIIAKHRGMKAATFLITVASFFFYGWWDFRYVPLLFASICFNYFVGCQIEKSKGGWLWIGILGNVMLLGVFKYTGFLVETLNIITGAEITIPQIVLPLGISFFTFTQSAYLVDIYRSETKNSSFLTYCEFVTIFPHLIAGPIINHKEMIPQFTDKNNFVIKYQNVTKGLFLFVFGLFKKVVVADSLAPWVTDIFSRVDSLTFLEAWIGAISYTFQLYFDFSGYSEMALGLGLLFNLNLPINFNSPYQATSVIDFWRRWHMTLGTWVKDYLYIPMGGNRSGESRKMRNLFLSMLIIGLWHGAGWTFVFWGGLHGFFLMINHQWRRLHLTLPELVNWFLTFICVVVCWVFFRADSFYDGLAVLTTMTDVGKFVLPYHEKLVPYFSWFINKGVPLQVIGMSVRDFCYSLVWLSVLFPIVLFAPNPVKIMEYFKPDVKWLTILVVAMICVLFRFSQVSDFLYFQF